MSEIDPSNDVKIKGRLPGLLTLTFIILSISIILGFVIYQFTSGYFENMVMIKRSSGIKRNVEVILPDGSKVWLNSNSEIRFPKEFPFGRREVFFEGEAFFAIVQNEEKPFILNSINSRVEVVGTTFHLRAFPDESDLILNVVSGEVILFDKNSDKNAIQLKKGEEGVFNYHSGKILRLENQDINYLSWQTGKFFFKNTYFSEVIDKLITYYNTQIVLENEILQNCKLNLDINNLTLDQVMEAIKKQIPIEYENSAGKIIVRGKGCLK